MKGIFLGYAETDVQDKRTELFHVIIKAGLQAFPSDISFDKDFLNYIPGEIATAECAILVLGNKYGPVAVGGNSITHYQYNECKKKCDANPGFRLIVWHPSYFEFFNYDARQAELLSEIRNDISFNISLITVNYPIQLVSDLRLSFNEEKPKDYEISSSDIFMVHNEQDDDMAQEIMDLLNDIVPVEKLNIVQDSDIDYSEVCMQHIGKSKLAVVYFKESADWALPFTQQIWKKIGGASSHTPILLIGDEMPETNKNKKFKAPKVASLIVAGELIPLEIKVFYDKVIEGLIA